MKPFLFLGTRAEDDAADSEYAAVLRCAGLDERDVRRVRLERDALGEVDLDDWSGIVLGGGPFNISDPDDVKSPAQHRAEAELRDLAERVVEADFPFLGACYGVGVLGGLRGGLVDRTYGEPISRGRDHPDRRRRAPTRCSGALPPTFDAFLGHKEAVTRLPEGAVLLASSATCPVQAFRLGAQRLRHPVPPRARRRRPVPAHRRLPPPRLLRARRAGRGDPGDGPRRHVEHPPRLSRGSSSATPVDRYSVRSAA